ncbi:MAG: NUDIX domain-containing protein [Calditrichaeota bacterium]|nr:NUDIX domain-containing protein [Calditrichota bacterium]RQW06449.1 MAG: NUDIX domain-containing protein [Calditrichota bacterium]
MAKKMSAGLLVYRLGKGMPEVFLVHMGGPYWMKKDEGAWTIPKGEFSSDENPLEAAKREFKEETGFSIEGKFEPLTPITQAGGKEVHAWAAEADLDTAKIHSNTFTMEWPPGSGKQKEFPEVDKAAWINIPEAKKKIIKAQINFLDELDKKLKKRFSD